MKIAISMEMTCVLRDTWHAALNHEWYDFLSGHEIVPLCCHGAVPDPGQFNLLILTGGNDMPGIKTWRNNHYPQRDQFEKDLVQRFSAHDVPVVGICRGAHFLNYIQGGTVRLMDQPYDNVKVKLSPFEVTCHHTIQIDQLAPGFDAVLEDSSGIVELAISKSTRTMGIGWHPERTVNAHTRSYILNLIKDL